MDPFALELQLPVAVITKLTPLVQEKQIWGKKVFLHVCFPEKAFLAFFFFIHYSLTLSDTDSWETGLGYLPL